jgi:hypothetical protein
MLRAEMHERSGPNFASIVFAVYVAGGIASVGTTQLAARLLLRWTDPATSRSNAANLYVAAQLFDVLLVSSIGALVVYLILGLDGNGPTLLRSFAGVAVGSLIGTVIQISVVLNIRDAAGPNQAARFVTALQSVAYAPLMFIGLFVSALIISAGSGRDRATAASGREAPWEYKLPPGTTWRD